MTLIIPPEACWFIFGAVIGIGSILIIATIWKTA